MTRSDVFTVIADTTAVIAFALMFFSDGWYAGFLAGFLFMGFLVRVFAWHLNRRREK